MGYLPPILWFHLLLIQFQCQEKRKGGWAPAPDVSCFVETGELLSQMRYYMQVHVCTCCLGWLACVRISMTILKTIAAPFLKKVLKTQGKCVRVCFSKDHYEIMVLSHTFTGPLPRDGVCLLVNRWESLLYIACRIAKQQNDSTNTVNTDNRTAA